MVDIDYSALDDANKGLGISFIVSIFAANCVLIFITIRKGGFFYTPKSLTVISLAIGDILMALFPLAIMTRKFFDDLISFSCNTELSYFVYINFLIHFVYSTGIVVLAAELLYRIKTSQIAEMTPANVVKSFLCSAFPWILGLIIILPLVLAGQAVEYGLILVCKGALTVGRYKTTLGVCVILPAGVAVLVCIVVLCNRVIHVIYTTPAVTQQSNTVLAIPGQPQNKEKVILCLISVINFLCIVPNAVFTIGFITRSSSWSSTEIILDNSFFWLSVFRSLVTPIIFSYWIK